MDIEKESIITEADANAEKTDEEIICNEAEMQKLRVQQELEANERFAQSKKFLKPVIAVYDMFDFQYKRFCAENATQLNALEQQELLDGMIEFVQETDVTAILNEITLCLKNQQAKAEKNNVVLTNGQLADIFAELLFLLDDIAADHHVVFMQADDLTSKFVKCVAVKKVTNVEAERREILRRGVIYNDNSLPDFAKPIRYQEIKIFKKSEE